ncbi:6197_t:CDS:2 [Cetraspora pellucida]|uniref:6197_t:CDS:1 n=1 Tax=Cetraspora pellucida TaxID=1433469 RepID=A0A9N9GGT6_9GLOM|nr:6197_t:CDS:2 [Cetraspora pellucida]
MKNLHERTSRLAALATVINSIRVIASHGSQNTSPENVTVTLGDKNSTSSICVDCLYYDYGYFYLHLIVYVIIFLITAFGLIVVCCAESPALLKIYSTLFYVVVIGQILFYIFLIIITAAYKQKIIDSCKNNDNTRENDCNTAYNIAAITNLVGYGISAIISIHFASVIREYSIRRKAEEDNPDISK